MRQELARSGARGGVVDATLSCVGGLKGAPMLGGYTRCARKSFSLAVQTTVHSSPPDVLSSSRVLRFVRTDETFLPEGSEIYPVIQHYEYEPLTALQTYYEILGTKI